MILDHEWMAAAAGSNTTFSAAGAVASAELATARRLMLPVTQ